MEFASYLTNKVQEESKDLIEYLQEQKIIEPVEGADVNGPWIINPKVLLKENSMLGNGTGNKDVYILEKVVGTKPEEASYKVFYYDKNGNKERELGELVDSGNVKSSEENNISLDSQIKRIEDLIALIQTAEGAMSEMHEILQRMNELVVQILNFEQANYSEADKNSIIKEIKSLAEELTNTSNTTEYNGTKLLNGELRKSLGIDDMELIIGDLSAKGLNLDDYSNMDENWEKTEVEEYQNKVLTAISTVSKERSNAGNMQDMLERVLLFYNGVNEALSEGKGKDEIKSLSKTIIKEMLNRVEEIFTQFTNEPEFFESEKSQIPDIMVIFLKGIKDICNFEYNNQKVLDLDLNKLGLNKYLTEYPENVDELNAIIESFNEAENVLNESN